MATDEELLSAGRELLAREAAYLDERRWDEWLALFSEDCEYWAPTWRSDEALTCDPQAELSHIYYAGRAGLEDRIVRIRSGKSPASTPMPRTAHIVGNVLLTGREGDRIMRLRSAWACHVFNVRTRNSHAFFGHAEWQLRVRDRRWLIAKKKTILANDVVPTMLDVYCI
ncbi:MAG: aromatic-ring-hydroxylating dioxygenase subunit beta [Betaproteobacteria bacterium]